MKVTHFRLRDTEQTSDQTWQGLGVVTVYALERLKSKNKWEQVVDDHPIMGMGFEQGVRNLRWFVHARGNIHAYQLDGVDPEPLIAVPDGHTIERLYHKGAKSYYLPEWYHPASQADEEKFDRVFKRYGAALAYLREMVGPQQYAYDVYTGVL